MKGLDILGMAHKKFPFKMVRNQIAKYPKPVAIGAFADPTFGTRDMFRARLQELCELKNVKLVRVHAWWNDNHNELCPIPHLKQICNLMQNFADIYKRIEFGLSHTCEYYSQNKDAVEKRVRIIEEEAGKRVFTVNNPSGKGVHVRAQVLERHHDVLVPSGQGVSLDGKDATEVRALKRWIQNNEKAKYAMLWIHSFNLRELGVKPPPRPERTVRVTKAEMEWLRQYF